ncbi:MAG: protein IcmS [Gammaproteobacteria bacterium]|jgi:intracellular multiplication protein IcmS|nr:protein IcmS [Gammaproteobacteria bacterium]
MEINKQLVNITKEMGVGFVLNSKPMSATEVFSDTGLLPALTRRADQLCTLCFGYGLGVSFEESDKSALGVRVIFDEATPSVLRLMCITDVLFELKQASQTPNVITLDELMYD